MKHKVKLTVIDKKLYPELQSEHCLNLQSGACPCYNVGDEFCFFFVTETGTISGIAV